MITLDPAIEAINFNLLTKPLLRQHLRGVGLVGKGRGQFRRLWKATGSRKEKLRVLLVIVRLRRRAR